MFSIKKNTTPGECVAMRCKAPALDQLCPLHTKEWNDAGQPKLETAAKKAPAAGVGGALTEAEQQAMVLERDTAVAGIKLAETFPVDTPENRAQFMAFINQALDRVKALDEHRLAKTKPLRDTVEWINRIHNDVKEGYVKFAEVGKGRIAAELLRLENEKRAAIKLIELSAGSAPADAFLAAHSDTAAPATAGGSRVEYTFRVVDPSKIPDWAWMRVLDRGVIQGKLDAAAAQNREPEEIPGLEITKTMTLIKGKAA